MYPILILAVCDDEREQTETIHVVHSFYLDFIFWRIVKFEKFYRKADKKLKQQYCNYRYVRDFQK